MNPKLVWCAGLLMVILSGCGHSTIGKVPLVDGKLPSFFKVGETKPSEVLDRYGQPSGYREFQNRSVMIYEFSDTEMIFIPLKWGSYRIYLVFEDNILKKTEVQRLGMKTEPGWQAK